VHLDRAAGLRPRQVPDDGPAGAGQDPLIDAGASAPRASLRLDAAELTRAEPAAGNAIELEHPPRPASRGLPSAHTLDRPARDLFAHRTSLFLSALGAGKAEPGLRFKPNHSRDGTLPTHRQPCGNALVRLNERFDRRSGASRCAVPGSAGSPCSRIVVVSSLRLRHATKNPAGPGTWPPAVAADTRPGRCRLLGAAASCSCPRAVEGSSLRSHAHVLWPPLPSQTGAPTPQELPVMSRRWCKSRSPLA
jgi:hypothetical protein